MARKNTLFSLIFTSRGKDIGILLLRLLSGSMMITHGIAKVSNFAELSTTFADPIGLGSKLSLLLIIAAEVGGAILIITGTITRLAALALMFGMGVAAFIAHSPFTLSGSELPLLYLVVFTALLLTGGGRFSVDEAIRRRYYQQG